MKRITSVDLITSMQTGTMPQPTEAVVITQSGKDLFIVLSVDAYVRLQGNDHQSVDKLEIPDADLDSIEWNR